MPTTLNARPAASRSNAFHAVHNRRASSLPQRGLEPEFDDRPMVAVYAFSAVLTVIGLLLLAA
jgi:hypothetical protein